MKNVICIKCNGLLMQMKGYGDDFNIKPKFCLVQKHNLKIMWTSSTLRGWVLNLI